MRCTIFAFGGLVGFVLCWTFNYFYFLRGFGSSVWISNNHSFVEASNSSSRSSFITSSEDIPKKADAELLIHTYHEGKLFPGYEVIMDSYLVTQDLRSTKFVQWTDEDWSESQDQFKRWIYERYRQCSNIEFREVELAALTKDTCFAEREEFLSRDSMEKYGLRDWSNVIRILLLRHYGGVWIDSDTILLFDLQHIHRTNPTALTAGYAPDNNNKGNKEAGFFNNNFLMATDLTVRKAFVDAACQFRRQPLGTTDKKGKKEFVNIVPLMGKDKHELPVMNHWLFNDGALKMCNIREDCNLVWIGLGETDPAWMRTLDMYSMCEKMRSSFGSYVDNFSDLLHMQGWRDTSAYLKARDWKKTIWTIHSRAAHCRSVTRPAGLIEYAGVAISNRMGLNPRDAPVLPVDFMSYDIMNVKVPDALVSFFNVAIIVNSVGTNYVQRQTLRGVINNPAWQRYIGSSLSAKHKLFFVVNYDKNVKNNGIGELQEEQQTHGDLLLIDYIAEEKDGYSKHKAAVTESARRALLKLLNRYEFRYYVLLNKTTIFVDMRNLWLLLDEASGNRTVNKERGIHAFLLSHKPDAKDVRDSLSKGGLSEFNVVSVDAQPDFILFTRSNLPVILGLPSLNPDTEKKTKDEVSQKPVVRLSGIAEDVGTGAEDGAPGDDDRETVIVDPEDPAEYNLVEVPITVVEAVRRVSLSVHQTAIPCGVEQASKWRGQLCANITDSFDSGVTADFNDFASTSSVIQIIQGSANCKIAPRKAGGDPLMATLPMNGVTFVRNVPCPAAMFALLTASLSIERDEAYLNIFK
eukprot:Lankesteria_metandrocarpae@DN4038_c0_g1_i2.p1